MKTFFCDCTKFEFWYVNDDVPNEPVDVCRCGHLAREHLDCRLSCTGEVWINGGVSASAST